MAASDLEAISIFGPATGLNEWLIEEIKKDG